MALTQARDGGGLDKDSSRGNGDQRADSEYILGVELSVPTDKLDVRQEAKVALGNESQILT